MPAQFCPGRTVITGSEGVRRRNPLSSLNRVELVARAVELLNALLSTLLAEERLKRSTVGVLVPTMVPVRENEDVTIASNR